MKNLRHFSLWFLFLSTFGFAGGGYFLLFFLVPFEEGLIQKGYTQEKIDHLLSYFVYGWIAFGFFMSFIYYGFVLRKKKRILALVLVFITTINAGLVMYQFMNTNSAVVAMSQGEEVKVTEHLTFGPYPTEGDLQRLKEQGYDGVVALLSPTIPFENKLLKDEFVSGKTVGISVHSFPMLPWIGNNEGSLDAMKKLVTNNPDKRYYFHCYLGKHRVDMAKQVVLKGSETEQTEKVTGIPNPQNTFSILDFERGMIQQFGNIIIGPYPTDEEWFSLLRFGVKEVVSFLGPNHSFTIDEKQLLAQRNIEYTSIPVMLDSPSRKDLDDIIAYLDHTDHIVYVHDFSREVITNSLSYRMEHETMPLNVNKLPALFQKGNVNSLSNIALFGPEPSPEEWGELTAARVQKVVLLGNSLNVPIGEIPDATMSFEWIPTSENPSVKELYELAKRLSKEYLPVYIYGLTEEAQLTLKTMMDGMIYGFTKDLLQWFLDNNFHLPEPMLLGPTKIEAEMKRNTLTQLSGENVIFYRRKAIFGPPLTEYQIESFLQKKGVERVVIVYAASLMEKEDISHQENLLKNAGLEVITIPYHENIIDRLKPFVHDFKTTTYVLVPPSKLSDLLKDLR